MDGLNAAENRDVEKRPLGHNFLILKNYSSSRADFFPSMGKSALPTSMLVVRGSIYFLSQEGLIRPHLQVGAFFYKIP